MKFISWNVNGLRACLKQGFEDFFWAQDADFICLQEIKMEKGQADFDPPGYFDYYNSAVKKGYSGTAIFTKTLPDDVSYGMGIPEHDQEGRIITLKYPNFTLVNCYTPNSKRELERLEYRMVWEDAFRDYLGRLRQENPVVVCGDFNVAHREIDLKNPKSNTRNAGFTIEERSKFSELLASGFTDSFRFLYPDLEGAYTWWSYMFNARAKNVGWRIDYFLVSEESSGKIRESRILSDVYGSDHCPVELVADF